MEEYTNGQQKVGPTEMSSDEALRKMRTAGSISLTPELFEKLYLQPQNKVKGDLRKTFANPTPMYVQPLPAFPVHQLIFYLVPSLVFSCALAHCPAISWVGVELEVLVPQTGKRTMKLSQ